MTKLEQTLEILSAFFITGVGLFMVGWILILIGDLYENHKQKTTRTNRKM